MGRNFHRHTPESSPIKKQKEVTSVGREANMMRPAQKKLCGSTSPRFAGRREEDWTHVLLNTQSHVKSQWERYCWILLCWCKAACRCCVFCCRESELIHLSRDCDYWRDHWLCIGGVFWRKWNLKAVGVGLHATVAQTGLCWFCSFHFYVAIRLKGPACGEKGPLYPEDLLLCQGTLQSCSGLPPSTFKSARRGLIMYPLLQMPTKGTRIHDGLLDMTAV